METGLHVEKMGGAGLRDCHRRSPISRAERDSSPFGHQDHLMGTAIFV